MTAYALRDGEDTILVDPLGAAALAAAPARPPWRRAALY
jgi:hypothetical protein